MRSKTDRYINEIYRKLRLPRQLKKRIKLELESEISLRVQQGEKEEDVISSIGTPDELVEELRSNYENEYLQFRKKKVLTMIIWVVIAAVAGGTVLYSLIVLLYPQLVMPTVIGGAEGSRSVYIAYKWSMEERMMGLGLKSILFAFSLMQALRYRNLLSSKKDV